MSLLQAFEVASQAFFVGPRCSAAGAGLDGVSQFGRKLREPGSLIEAAVFDVPASVLRVRRLAVAGEDIDLFGEGEERRDHVLIDDVAELVVGVLRYRSTGELNLATGHVASFRDVAETVVSLYGSDVAIRNHERVGPMPHNGYRPFDPAATLAAFPDFSYTSLADGLARVRDKEQEARHG